MHKSIADELLRRAQMDQKMRNDAMDGGADWDSSVDTDNTAYLKSIVKSIGWPTIKDVGQEAASAAWLLAQHADQDPAFQERCLQLMKKLSADAVSQANIAYLEDRVRVARHGPQLYGTQFYQEGDYFGPRPIKDAGNLDRRRKDVGLQPFRVYEAMMQAYRK